MSRFHKTRYTNSQDLQVNDQSPWSGQVVNDSINSEVPEFEEGRNFLKVIAESVAIATFLKSLFFQSFPLSKEKTKQSRLFLIISSACAIP